MQNHEHLSDASKFYSESSDFKSIQDKYMKKARLPIKASLFPIRTSLITDGLFVDNTIVNKSHIDFTSKSDVNKFDTAAQRNYSSKWIGQTRAKVFISCGQNRLFSDEVEIAHKIAERLSQLGYEPYIAVEEQTLRGVIENIFGQLETSEYFIFIDFKREQIVTNNEQIYRGSLFCHQELALASYLGLPIVAFQEKGVKQEDGLMGFLQGNSIPFSDRHLLANVIADTIQQRWDPHWKKQLYLDRENEQFVDSKRIPENKMARYFHVLVKNLNSRTPAINCYVYLEQVRDLSNNSNIPIETIEFEWAGYTQPNAVILPNASRHFRAFNILHQDAKKLCFDLFTDSSRFIPRINGPGEFELTYVVVSENFPPARRTFSLHIGDELDEIRFQPKSI